MDLQQTPYKERIHAHVKNLGEVEREIEDLRTNAQLIGETQRCLDRDGKLPMDWNGWCLTLAEANNLNPRRVRRVLKKHGLDLRVK